MNGGGGGGGAGAGAGGSRTGGGGGPVRVPTWRERENNRNRERRRRAIAAKIFTGLRAYGNYQLPKHCDNNEVLKAVCNEAGWTVEPDGTTYRKGCKPPPAAGDHTGIFRSLSTSPLYPLSPRASYNPSSASSSSHITLGGGSSSNNFFFAGGGGSSSAAVAAGVDGGSNALPWIKAMTSTGGGPSSFPSSYGDTVSQSAPVTPPTSSSPPFSPQLKKMARWVENSNKPLAGSTAKALAPWVTVTGGGSSSGKRCASSYTMPPSPSGVGATADPATWQPGFKASTTIGTGDKSPDFTFVPPPPGPLGAYVAPSSSRLRKSGKSSHPLSPFAAHGAAVARDAAEAAEADQCKLSLGGSAAMLRAWEGEVIKECADEELELTLGSSRTRADRA